MFFKTHRHFWTPEKKTNIHTHTHTQVLMGLAPDHGLLVPESIPRVDAATLARWSTLAFDELSFEVISLYVDRAEISCVELRALTQRAYSTFRDAGVTPVVPLGDDDMSFS